MSSQRSRLTLKNETKFLLSVNESKSRLENFIRFVIISKHVKFVEHFLQYLAAKNKSIFGSWDTSYVRKHTVYGLSGIFIHYQRSSPQGQWHLCGSVHKLNIPQTWRTYCSWGRGWWVRALLLGCRQSLKEYFSTAKTSNLIFFSLEVFPFCHFCLFKTISLWFSFTSAIPSSFLCLVFLLTLTAGRSKCATQVLHSCILCNEASLLQPQIQNSWFKKRWS